MSSIYGGFLLRPMYAENPDSLIAVGNVVAIEFAIIASANNYWR
ncbi:hexameric tyrosine-coordinated heme protein [Streptomyces sp. NPDC001340]